MNAAARFAPRPLLALPLVAILVVTSICASGRAGGQTFGEPDPTAGKYLFILFWKENNPATQNMADTLNAALANKLDRAQSTSVNIADPAQREIVDQYRVSRAPMPMVLCVAPNGAVTGAFPKRVTAQQIADAIVSPSMAECVRQLQAEKIVVVHVMSDPHAELPAGASHFIADPDFKARTATISLVGYDPAEADFLKGMEIDPARVNGSVVAIVAPPGTVVGRFNPSATKEDIAAALHAAGKCCNDPNCKHNRR